MTVILFHPTPPILCPISNHSLSISRKTLVGFSPIPKPTSIPSADFHPKSLANIIVSSPRNDAWRRLRSLLNRSQPCQWDASKESPYDQTPKASIPWNTGGRQGIWMQYVSVSLKMATVPLIYMRHQYISIMSTSSLKFIASVCTTVRHLNKMYTFVQPRTSLFWKAVGCSGRIRKFANDSKENERFLKLSQWQFSDFGIFTSNKVKRINKKPTGMKTNAYRILQDEGFSPSLETQVPCFTHEIILLGVDMDKEPFVHKEGQGKI